jgi:SAM-dependent methyltransferase
MTRTLDSYKGLATQFYDIDKPEAPAVALDFYWRRYEQAGGPVLEAMCGSGRFLLPFARRGADIDGVDASPHMLAACRRRVEEEGLAANIYEQFLQGLDLPRTYRFVFVPAGSFQLIPLADQQAALNTLARYMQPGAEFVVEMGFPGETRTGPSSVDPVRSVTRNDGAEIVLSGEPDGRMRYDLVREGVIEHTELETFILHPTPRAEFESMLAAAGLTNIRAWWPYKEEPARDNAPFAVFICTKAG